jgi:hypothetical protein
LWRFTCPDFAPEDPAAQALEVDLKSGQKQSEQWEEPKYERGEQPDRDDDQQVREARGGHGR